MARSVEARVLEIVGEIHDLLALDELQHRVLDALQRAVPSAWLSVNLMGPQPDQVRVVVHPELGPEAVGVFQRLARQNPLVARYERTRDSRPYRWSDLVTTGELHELDLYKELYGPLGIEYQIAFIVKTSPESYVGIALCRSDRDYADSERTVLDRLRPYLVQSYRNALAHEQLQARWDLHADGEALVGPLLARGLTPRPATIVSRVAHGQANAEIAAALGISERTVGKHLENAYRTLGVANRAEAARLAWTSPATS